MATITYWNRLEPRARTNDLGEALAAQIRDPLWLLARQWQLGELDGTDAGSPTLVELGVRTSAPTALILPNGTELPPAAPMEPRVFREDAAGDMMLSAEIGCLFESILDAHGLAISKDEVRLVLPLPTAGAAAADPATRDFLSVCGGRLVDGISLYRAAKASLPQIPAALSGVHAPEAALRDALVELVATADDLEVGLADSDPPAWNGRDLDYQFALRAPLPGGGTATITAAPDLDATLDWHAFDVDAMAPGASASPLVWTAVLPSDVRFSGMPSPRYWDFEDARVDFGKLHVDRRDLGRLVVIDFMLVHGDHWLLAPLSQPAGTLAQIEAVLVHDVFGELIAIEPATGPRWSMFALTRRDGGTDSLLFVPSCVGVAFDEGDEREVVDFIRDGQAELTWGIEVRTLNGIGEAALRHEAAAQQSGAQPTAAPVSAPLRFTLMTQIPRNYFPFAAISQVQPGRIAYERLAVPDAKGQPVQPTGRILGARGDAAQFIEEVAIQPSGLRVSRVPRAARWIDGTTHGWIARPRAPVASEPGPGLAFDTLSRNDGG